MKRLAPRRAGRPRDPEKGVAILDAGWTLFLAQGVEATPIEAIAAQAGVSKVTLYTYFPDKTALFRAAVEREMARIEAAQAAAGAGQPDAPIADRLTGFGTGLMQFLSSKPAIDFYSAVAGELRRHPDLARAFYDLGPGRTKANLAGLIRDAVGRHELRACDPDYAAEALFGLWQGFSNFQFSLDIDVEAIRRDLPRRVKAGVATFLKAYGPER